VIPLAPVALAALLAATPSLPPGAPLEILESGEIAFEPGSGRWELSGGAVLRRGDVTLRAARASYDRAKGEIWAWGGVLLVQPGRALAADSLRAVIDGPFEAHDVVVFNKEGPLDLTRCRTVDEVDATGRDRLRVGGARVAGASGNPRVAVSRPRITLCDCGAGPPSWEIRASSATVIAGSHAWLLGPVFWVTPRFLLVDHPVPVFVLPVVYVPLADRQSGLLFPELGYGRSGFSFSQPLFLALSRSLDATVTLDAAFGDEVAQLDAAAQVERRAVRGAGSSFELRWAPSEGSAGEARLAWLHDTSRDCVQRDAAGGCAPGFLSPQHGDRLALTLRHAQRLGPRADLRAEVGLVGDPLYVSDFTSDPLARAAGYRRSSLWVARRSDDALLAAEAGYHLAVGSVLGQRAFAVDPLTGAPRAPYGVLGADLPLLHRLPAVTATLLPRRLAGPLALSATLGIARFAPLTGSTGDEGADGRGPGGRLWTPESVDAGEGDGRWTEGERLATTRAALRATLRAPLTLGEWATVEPWVTGFAAGYSFDAGPGSRGDARVAGGLALSTRLTRRFGGWRHEVAPRAEWRAGSGGLGSALPSGAWDELDAARRPDVAASPRPRAGEAETLTAAPPGGFQQVSLSLRNRLIAGAATVDLTVGQDVDLERGRLAEAWLEAAIATGPLRATGEARLHPDGPPDPTVAAARPSGLDAWSLLRGTLVLADGRGDDLHASLVAMGPDGSERLSAGLEAVLDPTPPPVEPVAIGSAGARVRLGGGILGYDAEFNARTLEAPYCAGKSTAPHVYRHTATLGWDSPCKCFRVALTAALYECDPNPSVGFQFGLGELSGFRFGQ
jgi:LPS-assembly protein